MKIYILITLLALAGCGADAKLDDGECHALRYPGGAAECGGDFYPPME
ncbi:MAG: hypothetical protein ACKVOI_18175 [Dongiaceae bacterium]